MPRSSARHGQLLTNPKADSRLLFIMKKVALVLLLTGWAISFGVGLAQENPNNRQDSGMVKVQMHNVMYHFTDQIAVHLINVGGSLVPTSATTPCSAATSW